MSSIALYQWCIDLPVTTCFAERSRAAKRLTFRPMFIGEHTHTIDSKGRLSVPAKFRRQLENGIVLTRGLDSCLWLYTPDEWSKLATALAALPLSNKQSRAFSRLMLAGAWDAEVDTQGRVMIPEYLRDYASLKKHVTVAGLYNRVEIWDEDAWHTYRQQTESQSDAIAEGLSSLNI